MMMVVGFSLSVTSISAVVSYSRLSPSSLDAYFAQKISAEVAVRPLQVFNPATGELLGSLPDSGTDGTERAVKRASAALPDWARRTAHERSTLLKRWHSLILDHTDALAELMTLECGKPLTEARAEVAYGASFVEWFAEEAKRANGQVLPSPDRSRRTLVLRQPLGVVAAITPWNFPLAMVTRKAAPALAAGCTMVLKPSELTPYSALALGVLAMEAGIPDGVLEFVCGPDPAPIGAVLCTSREASWIRTHAHRPQVHLLQPFHAFR
jgi:succinate-semialdehyde dehydrogenase / glutarate-semialdehyde dehydrogenase